MPARLFVWVTQLVNCYKLQISLGINSTKVLDPARFKKVTRPTDSPPPHSPAPRSLPALRNKTDWFTSLLTKVSIPDCYLIYRYWRVSISQGFIFTIHFANMKRALNQPRPQGAFPCFGGGVEKNPGDEVGLEFRDSTILKFISFF